MGFLEALTILFIVLKLTGVIAWGWFFVFLPLIISVGTYVLLLIFTGFAIGGAGRRIRKGRK